VPAQAFVAQWLQSFKEFPARQKPASFSIDQVMKKLTSGAGAVAMLPGLADLPVRRVAELTPTAWAARS
jgi:hypothetical protein